MIRLTEGLCLLTNSLVKRATGKPTSVVSDYYWRARLRTRDSARSRGSRVVSTHGLNTQRMSAVQKVWSSYVYATILLQHGPTRPFYCNTGLLQMRRSGSGLRVWLRGRWRSSRCSRRSGPLLRSPRRRVSFSLWSGWLFFVSIRLGGLTDDVG